MKKQLNILLASFVLLCSYKGQESMIDNSVVKDLNIDRYLGTSGTKLLASITVLKEVWWG